MLPNLQRHKLFPLFLFIAALACALFSTNYFHYLLHLPGGEHFWRQADSASFVAYYYENGMNFFNTGTYNMDSIEGRSVSEFPILYYIAALFWKLFGRSEATLKIIDAVIVFTGFYCLFKVAQKQIGNIYIALLVTMLLLSSPLLLSYTNNVMPDPPALGFCFIGLYFIQLYIDKKQYKHFVLAYFFFTLSVLIKITMAIIPIAIIGLIFLDKIASRKTRKQPVFNQNIVRYCIPALAMFILVALWLQWVLYYNHKYQSSLFLTNIAPYWAADAKIISHVKKTVLDFWQSFFYLPLTFYVFTLIIAAGLLCIKKWSRYAIWLMAIVLVGSFMYGLLFFKQFGPHDYYMVPFMATLSLLVIFSTSAIYAYIKQFKPIISTTAIIIIFILANVFSYSYANKAIAKHRTRSGYSHLHLHPDVINGKAELYGLPKNATVFSFPDWTPNGSLYYLQRKGYTNWACFEVMPVTEKLKQYIPKGANYLVISVPSYYKYAKSNWFETEWVGTCNETRIYKVTSYDTTKWNSPQNP